MHTMIFKERGAISQLVTDGVE